MYCRFLKKILDKCFLPIFIFSNKAEESIINILKEKRVIKDNISRPIFVKSKSDIVIDNNVLVFQKIEEWINAMPSIYVLKEWDRAFLNAKLIYSRIYLQVMFIGLKCYGKLRLLMV